MGERIGRGQRHYENRAYEDSPYAAPLALRAVRASVVRRRNPVATAAGTLVDRIDDLIDGRGRDKAAPRPPDDIERRVEEPISDETLTLPRRKLGGTAIESLQDEAA
ncbi:MAG TPA: hypothetical protein VJM46_04580 [Candidatus Saccharimonadales bacterium]|nr:hypothetical protein [Candidatus Saccharimonadales bacterium]